MRLHYSGSEETICKLAKLGKAAWCNTPCTGRTARNINAGATLHSNFAKHPDFWTSPDFAGYCGCPMPDMNVPEETVIVCRTMKQAVEFMKVLYHEAEALVVTSNNPEALVRTGAGLFLCERFDDTPPIAKPVLHGLVKRSCRLILVGPRTIEWRRPLLFNMGPLTRGRNVGGILFFVGSGD